MWIVAGAGLYVIGTVLVTMVFNVPLNNALAAVDPASGEGAAVWADYLRTWTNWNHVRTLAALAASGAFISALIRCLTAAAIPAHVDVQMIVMVGVVIGAEDQVEIITGTVAHLAQEFRRWLAALPLLLESDEFSAAQTEARNIESIGGGMFAGGG